MARAHLWRGKLESEPRLTIKGLAKAEGVSHDYVIRFLPLAFLSPELVEQVLNGRQPRGLTVEAIRDRPLPLSWAEQHSAYLAR